MTRKVIVLILFLIAVYETVNAQSDTIFWNAEMQKIALPNSMAGWIKFKPEANLDVLSIFRKYKTAFGLHDRDEMKLIKTEKDGIGFTHCRYQQFNNGYRIAEGEFIVHIDAQKSITANGKMIRGLNKPASIRISKTQALRLATTFFPSAKYAWEIVQLENEKKEREHNKNATFYPAGELVWINLLNDNTQKTSGYELTYMFDIYTSSLDALRIFVSASSGKVVKTFTLVPICNGSSVPSNFNGVVNFSTRLVSTGPNNYNLWNDCQPEFIRTRLWNPILANSTDFSSSTNTWISVASAATSHWATERAYNYFLNIHGRQGWNNDNGGVDIYQNALFCTTPGPGCTLDNASNASFSSGVMRIGNNGNSLNIDDWNSLDIVAHEFTHGVTQSTSSLVYSKESGALNESFSDIFGATCYAWFSGLNANTWLVGFDRKNPNNTSQSLYIRNMSNPIDRNQPATYLTDTLWINTTQAIDPGDNWGVHTNSGVQNFMYYLMVAGGSGINFNGTIYTVPGIGLVDARTIAYRVLTQYLVGSSQYYDARNAWVHAAVDLFGPCSAQAIATGKAWAAVGIGPPLLNENICGSYTGSFTGIISGTYYLSTNCTLTINNGAFAHFGGGRVVMSPGFKARNGSNFRAFISDCGYAAY